MHTLGIAIWTVEQRISGCLILQGLSHGRRGYGIVALEAGKHPWTQERFDKCFPTTKNVFLNGMYLMEKFPALYNKALKLKYEYEEALKTYDVLILFTTSFVAKRHGTISTSIKTIEPTVGFMANTVQFDATGQPALSILIGWLPAKEEPEVLLPVATQIASGLWSDDKVPKAGYAWERAFDWKLMKPTKVIPDQATKTVMAVALTAEIQ